jgi:large subunit ribosomal protein L32
MPVPKRKLSRKRRDQRSANKGIKPHIVAFCQTCQAPKTAHSICMECGFYKGTKVLRTKAERSHDRTTIKETRNMVAQAKHVMPTDASASQTGENAGE